MDSYTLEEFKHLAKSLLDRAGGASQEQIDAGLKMFHIAFLNLASDTSDLDRYQALIVVTLVHRELGLV
jgi:hypothetical protein